MREAWAVSDPGGGPAVRGGGEPAAESRRAGSRSLRLLVQLLLTVGLTWLIVARVGVTLEEALSLEAAVPAVRPALLAASVLLLLLAFGYAARLWGWMARELGGADPGALASVRIVLTANLGRYIPGKVWQIAGLAVLSRRAGMPASAGAAAGIVGQLFHLAGAAVVGGVALAGSRAWSGPAGAALAAVVLLVVLASLPPVLRAGLRVAFRLARIQEAGVPRPDLLFGPRWLLLHTLAWVLYGAAFVLFVGGLGVEVGAEAPALAAAFAAAYLLGYLAVFAPAGIGVREGVLIALARPSLGAGAVGVAVLARVWMTLAELVPAGGLALWEIFRRRGRATPGGGDA